MDFEAAAASIAHLADEYTDRGWNDEGRAKFAAIILRRLKRFAQSPTLHGGGEGNQGLSSSIAESALMPKRSSTETEGH